MIPTLASTLPGRAARRLAGHAICRRPAHPARTFAGEARA